MKKFLSLLSFIFLFASCTNLSNHKSNKNSSDSTTIQNHTEELALYTICKDYKVSVAEMESNLFEVLSLNNTSEVSNRSSNLDTSQIYNIKQLTTDNITVANKNNLERNNLTDEYDSVPVYLYSVENSQTSETGFAITSTDRRVGLVLASVENGTFEDNDELSSYLAGMIANYIESSIDSWNSLTDEELNKARSAYAPYGEDTSYTFSNFSYNSGNLKNILVTKWNQKSPFNDIINEVKNDGINYPAGCIPIAVAQVFSKIRPFSKCSAPGYTNIVYEWDKMTNPTAYFTVNPSKYYSIGKHYDTRIKRELAALVYEICLGAKASFDEEGTGVSDPNLIKYLDSLKLKYDTSSYSYNNIVNSINNGYLVLAGGYAHKKIKKTKFLGITIKTTTKYESGHEFVIDGYANYTCDVTDSRQLKTTITTDFVHVNYGWGDADKDGFYLSGIFNKNQTPLDDNHRALNNSEHDGYYQYNIDIIYNLRK